MRRVVATTNSYNAARLDWQTLALGGCPWLNCSDLARVSSRQGESSGDASGRIILR